MKSIINEIKSEYAKLKSMTVVADEENNVIRLIGCRHCSYDNKATSAQIKYLKSFDNISYRSTSNLMKTNKWFMSACISIAKKYEDVDFTVVVA